MFSNDKNVKVLLISPLPSPTGGIATWTKLFINSDQANKNVVDVVNTAIIGKRTKSYKKKYLIEECKRTISIYLETKIKLENNYDIVHINSSCSTWGMIRDYMCIKKAKKSKSKVVVHFHCDTSYMVKGKFSSFIFRGICNNVDRIFCLNQSSEQHIKRISNKTGIKIPNFIDLKNIDFTQNEVSDRIKNIIFVGHIIKSKGCMDIISIAKKMPNINFKLVGKESEEFQSIPKPQNIQYCGEVSKEEVINQMLSADLLLFPTYTEGFPNVILEAMVSGLPVISTPVGAIPEIIENKGGKIIEVGNIEGFIKAIEDLQEPTTREKMSAWNKEKVKRTYALDLVMKQIFMEYIRI